MLAGEIKIDCEQGYTDEVIGTHAGLSDTTTLMAVAPQHVRVDLMKAGQGFDVDGVTGDPSASSIELGNIGMEFLVNDAMKQINELLAD